MRELSRRPSNRRSQADLDAMLVRYGIPGITGIDTRRLTRLIRDTGAIPGAFGPADDLDALRAAAAAEPGTDGIDLVATVTTPEPYTVGGRRAAARSSPTTSASSARSCATSPGSARSRSCRPSTPAADVLAREPDGVFLSNGPGDPAEVAVRGRGHPRAARRGARSSASASATSCSAGRSAATTVKLPFGHHGANHPVKDLTTGAIEITSQNHNFAVAVDTLAGRRRADPRQPQRRRVRGARRPRRRRVQRAAPPRGRPRSARQRYLFARFAERMAVHRGRGAPAPARLTVCRPRAGSACRCRRAGVA